MDDIKKAISEYFRKVESELSIKEVGRALSIDKDTASKYIAILAAERKLEQTRKVGNTKFFRIRMGPKAHIRTGAKSIDALMRSGFASKLFTTEELQKLKDAKQILERGDSNEI